MARIIKVTDEDKDVLFYVFNSVSGFVDGDIPELWLNVKLITEEGISENWDNVNLFDSRYNFERIDPELENLLFGIVDQGQLKFREFKSRLVRRFEEFLS